MDDVPFYIYAIFLSLACYGASVVRRRSWLGLGLLLGAVLLSVPPFFVFMLVVLSV